MTQTIPELPVIERSSLKLGTFIDLAASTKTRADFTVIATCGIDSEENIYILNILRGRWEWPDAREKIIEEILAQGVRLAGVETNGFQLSSFQELVRESRLRNVAFYPVPVSSDKVSRALLCSARGAAGKLFYRKNAAWFEDLVYELTNFPGGDHDDIVDAVSGCVELLNNFQVANPIVLPGVPKRRSKWRGRG
ncbi:MAG: Terminase-like family protein [Methanosaeta sp. PtaU1.Bin060]|jgi:predicted phage terminase large subunit-like protein|nr:MAG: Terminase-like family protein [Methanosaeta sp. PtaU1.Bin060]